MLQKQFKSILREYRKANHISRNKMSEILNVSESLIGMYERGERNIPLDIANKVCELNGQQISVSPIGSVPLPSDPVSLANVINGALVAINDKFEAKRIREYKPSLYELLVDRYKDWKQMGYDPRGIQWMLKEIVDERGKMVTVEIGEYGLHLYKIDGQHQLLSMDCYDELMAADPTPYIDRYITFSERDLVSDRSQDMPFDQETKETLSQLAKEFVQFVRDFYANKHA